MFETMVFNSAINKIFKTNVNYSRKTPIVLTGILINVLKRYFSQDSDFTYTKEDAESKIIIQPAFLWTPASCQNRPGIYIKRNAINVGNPRAGMDDMYSFNNQTGCIEYACFQSFSFSTMCISKQPGTVEIIAEKVFEALYLFSPIIKRDFKLDKFIVNQISPITQIEESKEFYIVQVISDGLFNETWTLKPDVQKLMDIKINIDFTV